MSAPENPATPNNTYDTDELDLAIWREPVPGMDETGEWELMDYTITSLEDGERRLAAKRKAAAGHASDWKDRIRLVRVQRTTKITDLGK